MILPRLSLAQRLCRARIIHGGCAQYRERLKALLPFAGMEERTSLFLLSLKT